MFAWEFLASGVCRRDRIPSFFFFQAEDGIRDDLVTGVQTCALPISGQSPGATPLEGVLDNARFRGRIGGSSGDSGTPLPPRSEERRVGKECRSRWSPYH